MANQIILKRSSTPGKVPLVAQLALGEIAINTHDGRIYIKKDDGVPAVVEIGGVTSVNTQGGDVVLGTGDVLETGSNQYFTTARARASIAAGTGIAYNSTTGVVSTSQNLSTAGTPTFAGATLTGDLTVRHIIPSASNTYDLGSVANPFRHMYVGPGSLYVNGKQVLTETSGTMTFTADVDQNMRITTTGTGLLQLGSSTTGVNIDGTMQIAAGKRITSSDGVKVQFGDDVELNGNKVIGLGTPTSGSDAATKTYVDSSISAISTSTISQGNSNIAVVDNGTGTVTVTVDGNTALTVTAAGVVIAGNMTVEGTTTSVNSNTISLADNIITLNSDATGTPTQNAGIEVERGDEANVQLRWNEGSQKWTFTNDGAVYTQIATSTDTLTEGTTQLYFSNTRARAALSSNSSSGVAYNSASGLISLGSIPNSSLTNNTITVNNAVATLGGSIELTTSDVNEGTNQYFTTARARSSVSAGTGIAYNSTTGVISTSAIPNASLTNSSVTIGSTSVSLGATAATVAGLTLTSPTINGATVGGHLVPDTDIVHDLGTATKRFRDLYLSGSTIKLGDATISATPTGSLTLGGTAGSGTVVTSDANGDFTAGTITAALVGNASTSTTLKTARTISGTSFDGSANITLSTAGITEDTKLFFTDARAVTANTAVIATAKSEAISAAATDATSKVAAEATARGTAIATAKSEAIAAAATDATTKASAAQTAAISAAATDATSKVAAEATARGTAIATAKSEAIAAAATDATTKANSAQSNAASDATTKASAAQTAAISAAATDATTKASAAQTAAISAAATDATDKVAAEATARDAAITSRISTGLTHFHSAFQSVTSAQATTNVSGTVAYTFADLATAKHYNVYLNRTLLRPTEFSVSGSVVTVVAGVLSTDDEIEVTGLKFA